MQTVADLAAHGQLPSDIYLKQLLGQINLQLRRMVQGHTSLPEAILRDALFFVAQAPEPTLDARMLRDAHGIEGQVPHDYLTRRYGRIDREALKDAKEALAKTKEGWDRLAGEGVPEQEADFDAPWPGWPGPAKSWAHRNWRSCCASWARPRARP